MADAQEQQEMNRKLKEWRRWRLEEAETYWYPNSGGCSEWHAGHYFASSTWGDDEITSVPPMCFTDHLSSFSCPRDNLQIVSIKIASISGGLRWPIDVFGFVLARDVLDDKRNIIFERVRSNCQTITEEHPYLVLNGPARAVVTCSDPGDIEIVLKVKGATESDDRDLSFQVLNLQSARYFRGEYSSERSTLKLQFHHVERAVEATISVRLIGGPSLLPRGFQGVFTASTASIDDLEVVLLDFRDGEFPAANNGTINLSRRVVSVGYSRRDELKEDRLKVSVVAQIVEDEQNVIRDDIVFTPKTYGRSCGVFTVGVCKMQVTVSWSMFDY